MPRTRSLTAHHYGFPPDVQRAFLTALAECGSVVEAARRAGVTPAAAYRFRARGGPDGAFACAWDLAMHRALATLAESALARAINGTQVPVFYKGKVVAHKTVHNERLVMFLLQSNRVYRMQSLTRGFHRHDEQLAMQQYSELVDRMEPAIDAALTDRTDSPS